MIYQELNVVCQVEHFMHFQSNRNWNEWSEFCKKAMHEAGVAIVPGTAFGKTCNDYVRFSFAASQITYLTHWKILKKC